jgi:hypothetical protein
VLIQFNELKIIKRRDYIIQSINQDKIFMDKFPKGIMKISSQMNSYLALHASLNGLKVKTIKFFFYPFTKILQPYLKKELWLHSNIYYTINLIVFLEPI